jgi:hypothetical protein
MMLMMFATRGARFRAHRPRLDPRGRDAFVACGSVLGNSVRGSKWSGATVTYEMNRRGTPSNLIAAHPGNINAVRHGVHSPRLINARAAEIEERFTQQFDLSMSERVALHEATKLIAILDAIDTDLDERGFVDKNGKPRYLIESRLRLSRRLEQWLMKISPAIERQSAAAQPSEAPARVEYIRELQRIALGNDSAASARDRLTALKELLDLERGAAADSELVPDQQVHEEIVVVDLPAGQKERRVLVRHQAPEGSA